METTAICERLNSEPVVGRGTVSIGLVGQPYWTAKLEESLNQFGRSRLRAFSLPLKPAAVRELGQIRAADVLVSVGFRPGSPTRRGRAFDALWSALRWLNPHAVRVFYWVGTDVLNTTQDFEAGVLRHRPFARARQDHHLADAPWLVDELRDVGISALAKTLTLPDLAVAELAELPASFSVLTYIPDKRHSFYGAESLYAAARELREVRFHVVGGLGRWIAKPLPNLHFYGWQSDMKKFQKDASVLVRLVQHDGTGLTALEGLSMGRHVIYSYPLPHTIRVPWGDAAALVKALRNLFDLHQRGLLHLNTAGSEYVQKNFNHHDCMEDLTAYLLDLSCSRRERRLKRYER